MKLYRKATVKDGFLVANQLRPEDKREVEGMGHTPFHIPLCVLGSEHATVFHSPDGEIAGVAGIVRLDNQIGQIWMLCTPAITKYPHIFVRRSSKWLKEVQKEYRLLWAFADVRNLVHHKLLKHLGFKALRTVPVGPKNLPYYEIVKLCALSRRGQD